MSLYLPILPIHRPEAALHDFIGGTIYGVFTPTMRALGIAEKRARIEESILAQRPW